MKPAPPVWRPPTRRTFVAMLALLAVRLPKPKKQAPPKIWIGHL